MSSGSIASFRPGDWGSRRPFMAIRVGPDERWIEVQGHTVQGAALEQPPSLVASWKALLKVQDRVDDREAQSSSGTNDPEDCALSPLQDVHDQQDYEPQHDDADKTALPASPPRRNIGAEFTPIPLVGIIGVLRHRVYRRGHQPSEGSRSSIWLGTGYSRSAVEPGVGLIVYIAFCKIQPFS